MQARLATVIVRRTRRSWFGVGLAALIAITCAGVFAPTLLATAGTTEPIALQGGDFYFTGPQQLPAGPASIRFTNVGQESHHA